MGALIAATASLLSIGISDFVDQRSGKQTADRLYVRARTEVNMNAIYIRRICGSLNDSQLKLRHVITLKKLPVEPVEISTTLLVSNYLDRYLRSAEVEKYGKQNDLAFISVYRSLVSESEKERHVYGISVRDYGTAINADKRDWPVLVSSAYRLRSSAASMISIYDNILVHSNAWFEVCFTACLNNAKTKPASDHGHGPIILTGITLPTVQATVDRRRYYRHVESS